MNFSSNTNYQKKYLKYKAKYLQLKGAGGRTPRIIKMSSADELVGGSAASVDDVIQNLQKLHNSISQVITRMKNEEKEENNQMTPTINYINTDYDKILYDITTMKNHLGLVLRVAPTLINNTDVIFNLIYFNLLQLRGMVIQVINQGNNIDVNYINENYYNILDDIRQMQTRLRPILGITQTG
jgi:hypothetical protein